MQFKELVQIEEVLEGRKYIFDGSEIIIKEISADINFPERKMDYNEVWEIMQNFLFFQLKKEIKSKLFI